MTEQKPSVLLIEDTTSLALIYQQYLKDEDISLIHAPTGREAEKLVDSNPPDLILLDLGLPDMDGQEILKWIKDEGYPTQVVVITADSAVDTVVEVMRHGALDFLEKPFDAKRLRTTVRNALKQASLEHYVDDLKNTFERNTYHGFIGSSLPMQAVYHIIDSASPSKATVFITGESGTGKEVCAEAIHKQGPRAKGPFIALNCGAIPRDLMESEIFGHVKGAFTGAAAERKGAASLADGGTLFLDEIAEMDMDLQTKLLRFIQTGRFRKVGGNKEEIVDIRFICATNKDPLKEVNEGRFREDLYYRLHVIPIELPPLRERSEDILEIAEYLLKTYSAEEGKKFTGFSDEAAYVFNQYNWPGNVRQLQNIIRNVVVLHDDEKLQVMHLPPPLNSQFSEEELESHSQVHGDTGNVAIPNQDAQIPPDDIKPLAQVERETIEQAISLCDGNIPRAAALLDVSPSTIYRKKGTWSSD
jgi:DNA-binding NtrC family response regulator